MSANSEAILFNLQEMELPSKTVTKLDGIVWHTWVSANTSVDFSDKMEATITWKFPYTGTFKGLIDMYKSGRRWTARQYL